MSYFGDFLDEELQLLISVPVRAAFWISHIDDAVGTERDDAMERVAVEKALRRIFKLTDDNAFTNDVVEEALKHRDLWAGWEATSSTVLDDIPAAMKLVHDRLPSDAVAGYQRAVFYIARVVAQAASEDEDAVGATKLPGFVQKMVDRFSVKTNLQTLDNTSPAERAALTKLQNALKLKG